MRLWQFRAGDRAQIVRRPGEGQSVTPRTGARRSTVLFDDTHEMVSVEDWSAAGSITVDNPRGLEFLVVSGSLTVLGERLHPLSWGRLPADTTLTADVATPGVRIWIKRGPLRYLDVCALPEQYEKA